jgi:hypothetical protein
VIFEPSLRLYFLRKLFIAALSGGDSKRFSFSSKNRTGSGQYRPLNEEVKIDESF